MTFKDMYIINSYTYAEMEKNHFYRIYFFLFLITFSDKLGTITSPFGVTIGTLSKTNSPERDRRTCPETA